MPMAVDDAAITTEDTSVTIAVLTYDADVEGDALIVAGVSAPPHGTAAVNADGTITYTPAANFNGVDSFSYTLSDGHGGSATGTVSINVTAVNDAPAAADDSYSTNEDTALNVAGPGVLANDSDVESDPLTAILVSGP